MPKNILKLTPQKARPHLRHKAISNLLRNKEQIGGLAITEDSVAITYLAQGTKNGSKDVLFQKEMRLPADTIVSGVLKNEAGLVNALQQIRADDNLPSSSVILSLPHTVAQPFVYDFAITMPSEEIGNALSLLSSSALPLSPAQTYVDWESIPSPDSGKNRFLVAMGVKDLINPYLAVLEKVGFAPVACETHAWSLPRSFPIFTDPSLVCYLTAHHTVFILYQFNVPIFQFDVPKDFLPEMHAQPEPLQTLNQKTSAKKTSVNDDSGALSSASRSGTRARHKEIHTQDAPDTSPTLLKNKGRGVDKLNTYKESATFLGRIMRFLASDREYSVEIKKIIILGSLENSSSFTSEMDKELLALVAPKPENTESLAGAFSLGSAKRALIPRGEDTISSLMPIGTELAYAHHRFASFIDFYQKLVGVLGILFIMLFTGTLILTNAMAQTIEKTLERQQLLVPPELAATKEIASSFNDALLPLSQIISATPEWDRLLQEIEDIITPGLQIQKISVSPNFSVTISGIAKHRDDLLALRTSLDNHPIFFPITLPLSALLTKENIAFSVQTDLKNNAVLFGK